MATEAASTGVVATARPPASRAAKATAVASAKGHSRAKAAPSPSTLILFVRHGTTPTTGQVLPGRAPGLHLADSGRAEAEALAERLSSLSSAAPAPSASPAASASSAAPASSASSASPAASASSAAPASSASSASPASASSGKSTGNGRTAKADKPAPGLTVAAVYASPLERARETAAPIAKRFGHKVTIERGLIEMDFGEWTGADLKALRKLPEWNSVQRYPSGFQFPGGEGFSAMRARMAETVAAICRRHPGETVVAVSHADTIKAVVSDALGTHLDLFQRIVVSPCSVTAISYTATGPIVLAVNSTGGLAGLGPS